MSTFQLDVKHVGMAAYVFDRLVTECGRRYCWYAPGSKNEDGRYKLVLVVEDEPEYFELADAVNRSLGQRNLGLAEFAASTQNALLGLSDDDSTHIIASSFIAARRKGKF